MKAAFLAAPRCVAGCFVLAFALAALPAVAGQAPIVIGLSADMSSASAQSGEAIRRGAAIAIAEINATGGVLGRPLELTVRDHRGNPARGRDNIDDLARQSDLVAVIGGLHTPVALYELEPVHRHRLIYLDPWAAGTPVVDNGYDPNYVFRVSVRDAYAGEFLIRQAIAAGFRQPGLLLERTGWGRSNEAALLDALESRGMKAAGVAWFNWGVSRAEMKERLQSLRSAGADVILLVSNPREGAVTVKVMAGMPPGERPPIISHWGVTGADFASLAGDGLKQVDFTFLQTYSFLDPPFPTRANKVIEAYCRQFAECSGPRGIPSPAGTAHAYDLVHLLARAIESAGTVDRPAIRDALETLGRYEGLVRDYDPPFTAQRHDALNESDFRLARFGEDGSIVPDGKK
ncbi:MAG: ABC transporter substrate-binding protein [Proteobacteria bacterium]|nr:ABC transporter substrate-binding protein [Pseudomonadota bacterium]MCK4868081.1 ABC transporter substrate-binding protein [Alphaproteobacteria bacterium]